jgi:heat shock protein HslJ
MDPAAKLRRLPGSSTDIVFAVGLSAGGPLSGGAEPPLAGRTFWSIAVTEHGLRRATPTRFRMTLWFTADGRLVATGGCNSLIGPVKLSDGRITLAEARMTEMAGADELMAQDRWLAALLDARPSWQLAGPHLRISAGGTTIELTDRRVLDPDRPLEGTRWVGSAVMGGRVTAPASLAALGRVLLVFADGRVTGSDSCQPLSGAAIVSGATIDFGPGPALARGSAAGPAADELTQHLRATLRGIVRYEIEADQLTLSGTDADGLGIGLYLTAVPASSPA